RVSSTRGTRHAKATPYRWSGRHRCVSWDRVIHVPRLPRSLRSERVRALYVSREPCLRSALEPDQRGLRYLSRAASDGMEGKARQDRLGSADFVAALSVLRLLCRSAEGHA